MNFLISNFSISFQEISLEFCFSLFFCLTQIFVYCYFGEMVVTEVRKFVYKIEDGLLLRFFRAFSSVVRQMPGYN